MYKKFIAVLVLIIAGIGLINIQPAGATTVATTRWIAGRVMINSARTAPVCSSGFHMKSNSGNHVLITPRHCIDASSTQYFENSSSNYFTASSIAYPNNALDVVAIVTGPTSNPFPMLVSLVISQGLLVVLLQVHGTIRILMVI